MKTKLNKRNLLLFFPMIMLVNAAYGQVVNDCVIPTKSNENIMSKNSSTDMIPDKNRVWYDMGIKAVNADMQEGAVRCFMHYVWEADNQKSALEVLLNLEKSQPDTALGHVVREARLKVLAEVAAQIESQSVFSSNVSK